MPSFWQKCPRLPRPRLIIARRPKRRPTAAAAGAVPPPPMEMPPVASNNSKLTRRSRERCHRLPTRTRTSMLMLVRLRPARSRKKTTRHPRPLFPQVIIMPRRASKVLAVASLIKPRGVSWQVQLFVPSRLLHVLVTTKRQRLTRKKATKAATRSRLVHHLRPPASQQGHGRRYPPNYEEQYAEYYYPPATPYPMPHMSLRMQAGRDHHRRGHSGEIFYSPGGPYPISAGGRHPVAVYRHREYEEGEPSDGVTGSDRQERLSRPPPEYTPPSAYFNRNASRQPSKHVEVTPNSHEESPLSRSKRPHAETQEGDPADEGGSGGSPEPGAVRSTQRRARFDESTERDQEDRDRRRAAAAAEAAAKGSGASKTSAIPPFPSPRWGASVSTADEKASGCQTKPYLPPPRPSTGSRFPYQDDESRLASEYVPTVTPRGEEASKPMHTFSSARPAPTPPPQEQQIEGPGWSPYPLNHHRRLPSGGFEFTIRPRDFGTSSGLEPSIVSTWGKSASWDNEEGTTDQGTPPTHSTPSKVPRTPQKGHRKSLPSVSMDYSDSPPGNVVFTPRSSFNPMAESHRFLPPTPGGFFNDPAEYLDYGDYQYA